MNDTMSLLLATSILAVGGLGLFMYKSSDENQSGGEEYNEDNLFSSSSLWGSNENENENINDDYNEEYEEEVYKPKTRAKASKTKRRKACGGTKRRY